MSGETRLDALLRGMTPVLHDETWSFVTLAPDADARALDAIGTFREAEGVTAIVPRARAVAAGLAPGSAQRMITLAVHSSLDAVGFVAAVASALAARGIGVNPVAAFHHDHLFVPAARADEAMAVLRALAARG